tara:strand:- start:9951 stop:10727 length:777 start_codon:yes stop_codon:yes gene_type:complete
MSIIKELPLNLQRAISSKSLFKVISGLKNFNSESVMRISRAAAKGGADLIDIACDPNLVHLASKEAKLPICVSAVEPKLFVPAVDAGASIVEVGNYDSFYPSGRKFEPDEILSIASETKSLLPDTVLSVTVPHTIPLDLQVDLAVELANNGVDIIQTEGGVSAKPFNSGNLGLIEKAAPTLAATSSIFQDFISLKIDVPIIAASGLSRITCPMAIAVGASGVGVGSAINKLNDEIAMIAVVKDIRLAIDNLFSSQLIC